jgi:CO/xanthine dehydrogenase FAD-binding subunit
MDLNTIKEISRPGGRPELPAWRNGDGFLAGGTWLYSEPQPNLTRLVDLAGLGWTPLEADAGGLTIAATCKIAQLHTFSAPVAWTAAPMIEQCCRSFLASFKIWNAATVGGNICLSLPAAPMISLVSGLEGVCILWAPDGGERKIPIVEFVTGPQQNILKPGELLRAVHLPATALSKRSAFRQISLTQLGRSAALLIGTLDPKNGAFILTVTASTRRPIQLRAAKLPSREALREQIQAEIATPLYFDDVHGAPAWREQMTYLLAEEIRDELARGGA